MNIMNYKDVREFRKYPGIILDGLRRTRNVLDKTSGFMG